MAYERRENTGGAPATTLASSIDSDDTSITIADGTGYPTGATGPFAIVIDRGLSTEEKIKCSSRSGTAITVAGSGRGYDDTTAASHSAGASVEHCVTAVDLDEANYAVSETVGRIAAKGDLLVGDAANSLDNLSVGSNNLLLVADSAQSLGVKWAALPSGAISASAMFAAGVVDAAAVGANAIGTSELAATVAGDGLAGGGGSALSVNVDDTTIEIATDSLAVKDGGIDADALAATVAGDGLAGGGGSALSVNVDDTTIEIATDSLAVKDGGIDADALADGAVTTAKLGAVTGCRVYRGTDQSIPNATDTAVSFSAERYDNGSCWTVGTPTRLVAPVTGLYHCGATIEWATSAVNVRTVFLRVNGSTNIASVRADAVTSGGVCRQTLSTDWYFTANDYVEVVVFQSSGGPLNVKASSALSPEAWLRFAGL